VLIVYRHPLLRDVLRCLLRDHDGVEMVGALTPEEVTAERLTEIAPTAVIVDRQILRDGYAGALELARSVLSVDALQRLIVLDLRDTGARIVTSRETADVGEAELIGALRGQ
jgi:DNA-binding NarL/FixJ family response regulator